MSARAGGQLLRAAPTLGDAAPVGGRGAGEGLPQRVREPDDPRPLRPGGGDLEGVQPPDRGPDRAWPAVGPGSCYAPPRRGRILCHRPRLRRRRPRHPRRRGRPSRTRRSSCQTRWSCARGSSSLAPRGRSWLSTSSFPGAGPRRRRRGSSSSTAVAGGAGTRARSGARPPTWPASASPASPSPTASPPTSGFRRSSRTSGQRCGGSVATPPSWAWTPPASARRADRPVATWWPCWARPRR